MRLLINFLMVFTSLLAKDIIAADGGVIIPELMLLSAESFEEVKSAIDSLPLDVQTKNGKDRLSNPVKKSSTIEYKVDSGLITIKKTSNPNALIMDDQVTISEDAIVIEIL